ncbi:MAG: preprotein translocase subunit SecE [Oscillospiraceae bacterium]|nr:preprotein translocase subunit SecE [Oscillospiraceae bacterium]
MAKDKELAAEKSSKKESSKKQGKIAKWFKDLKQELKKVVWPDRKTVTNNSIVVFAAMIGFAVFTFLLDEGFLWLFQFAISGKS